MSTRAIYTFTEDGTENMFHVYKHHDGYPSGGLETLRHAFLYFAWTLPRFEADEAAASFVAAGKAHNMIRATTADADTAEYLRSYLPGGIMRNYAGGGVRLLPSGKWHDVAPGDIEFRYVIRKPVGNKPVTVDVFAVNQDWPSGVWMQGKVVSLKLADLMSKSEEEFRAYVDKLDHKRVIARKLEVA